MENNIAVFEHEEFGSVRTIEMNNKVYFCGKDVAQILGYSDTAKAIRTHCKGVDEIATPTNGGIQKLKFITEGDLYRLITHSKLPSAEKFECWVFDTVLPSIRKHGGYLTPDKIAEAILNPDTIIKLATALKEEQERNLILEQDNQIMKPKANYYDKLVSTNLLTSIRETALELQVPEKELTKFLVKKKVLYRNKHGKLCAYAQYVKSKLFAVREWCGENGQKGTWTLVTPKGREVLNRSLQRYIVKHGGLQ